MSKFLDSIFNEIVVFFLIIIFIASIINSSVFLSFYYLGLISMFEVLIVFLPVVVSYLAIRTTFSLKK